MTPQERTHQALEEHAQRAGHHRSQPAPSSEHPVMQPIREIDVFISEGSSTTYRVGWNGVTRIEACTKSGLHADIPYVRVWRGDVCEAEFCQHNIVGVYFAHHAAEKQ